MKNLICLFAFLITVVSFGQQKKELKLNEDTNLIEATYYHDNGMVSQTGTFSVEGKLHGVWLSFDTEGNKLTSANYDNGKKVGKWFYWKDKTLKEVDYVNNEIVNVNEWSSKATQVHNN
jgi:hypothetical protein